MQQNTYQIEGYTFPAVKEENNEKRAHNKSCKSPNYEEIGINHKGIFKKANINNMSCNFNEMQKVDKSIHIPDKSINLTRIRLNPKSQKDKDQENIFVILSDNETENEKDNSSFYTSSIEISGLSKNKILAALKNTAFEEEGMKSNSFVENYLNNHFTLTNSNPTNDFPISIDPIFSKFREIKNLEVLPFNFDINSNSETANILNDDLGEKIKTNKVVNDEMNSSICYFFEKKNSSTSLNSNKNIQKNEQNNAGKAIRQSFVSSLGRNKKMKSAKLANLTTGEDNFHDKKSKQRRKSNFSKGKLENSNKVNFIQANNVNNIFLQKRSFKDSKRGSIKSDTASLGLNLETPDCRKNYNCNHNNHSDSDSYTDSGFSFENEQNSVNIIIVDEPGEGSINKEPRNKNSFIHKFYYDNNGDNIILHAQPHINPHSANLEQINTKKLSYSHVPISAKSNSNTDIIKLILNENLSENSRTTYTQDTILDNYEVPMLRNNYKYNSSPEENKCHKKAYSISSISSEDSKHSDFIKIEINNKKNGILNLDESQSK